MSVNSRTINQRSFNMTLSNFVTISLVTAVFERPKRPSSSMDVQPHLNSAAHCFIMKKEGENTSKYNLILYEELTLKTKYRTYLLHSITTKKQLNPHALLFPAPHLKN